MSRETLDQLSRSSCRDDLAVIDNRQTIAQSLGFVHVVCSQQHGTVASLELANDVPQLTPALWIEARGRFVEK